MCSTDSSSTDCARRRVTYTEGILTLHMPTLKPPYDHNIFKLSQPLLLMKTLSLSFKASCYA